MKKERLFTILASTIVLILLFSNDVVSKNTKKVEREFRKRREICIVEQNRQQKSNIKHYKKTPIWCKTKGGK